MQAARDYIANTAFHMERALGQMAPAKILLEGKELPVTKQAVIRYVEQLLTPEEQYICNHATD